jgi:hypothetical protein
MTYKNSKKLLLIVAALIVLSLLYFTHDMLSYSGENLTVEQGDSEQHIIDSINIQNNVLNNYFESLYGSQISDINSKYEMGSISLEERNKQLNAVTKNQELTMNMLNKFTNAKKQLFTGNITKEDILIKINSFDDINSDIKSEINDTLNGY